MKNKFSYENVGENQFKAHTVNNGDENDFIGKNLARKVTNVNFQNCMNFF